MTGPGVVVAGRYRVVQRIAVGGMSSVWEAWDERLRRRVALKLLQPSAVASADDGTLGGQRAMREGRITARLHHPHAVTVYDVVDHDGAPCLVMQYVPSKSLQDVIAEHGTLPVREVARIGTEVAGALAAAHAAAIVHRDVKPGNVLIAEDGRALITDFGISHAMGDVTLTSTGMVTGTPAFLAPEVARGDESGFPADVFSLGSTLYAALEGTPPFGTAENPMAVLHRVASGRIMPPQRSGVLTPVLTRMLEPVPADRPSMAEVERELAAALRSGADLADDTTAQIAATRRFLAPSQQPPPQQAPSQQLPPQHVPPSTTVSVPPVDPRAVPQFRPRPAPAVPAPLAAPVRTDGPRQRRGGGLLIPALVALVVVAAGVIYLVTKASPSGPSGTSSTRAATGSTQRSVARRSSGSSAPRSTGSAPATRPETKASSSASRSSASSSSRPGSASASPSSSAGTSATSAASTGGSATQALTDYYALLPSNTDAAWQRLTPSYQQSPSGGRKSYDSYWAAVRTVSATDVVSTGARQVQATITYHFRNGRVSVERTAFGFVQEGDTLKIDSSRVLNSTSG